MRKTGSIENDRPNPLYGAAEAILEFHRNINDKFTLLQKSRFSGFLRNPINPVAIEGN